MSTEQQKKYVHLFFDALERRDIDAILNLVDQDKFRLWSGGSLWFSGWRGLDKMREGHGISAQFPAGIKFTISGMIAQANRVAAEVESNAEHFTGRVYHNYYHFLFEFNDTGKIVACKEYLDTAMAGDLLGYDGPNSPPQEST